jgi:hypothetical protein
VGILRNYSNRDFATRQLNHLVEKARSTPTVMRSAPSVLPRKVIKLSRSQITELG